MRNNLLRVVALGLSFFISAESKPKLNLCIDKNSWHPFTYQDSDTSKAAGVYVDVFDLALADLGVQTEIHALPWKRCLHNAQYGKVDGILGISYSLKRDNFLYFPDTAKKIDDDEYRLSKVEYVYIINKNNDIKNLTPNSFPAVYVDNGFSVGDNLRYMGFNVEFGVSVAANIKKLLRKSNCAVVATKEQAENILRDPILGEDLKILENASIQKKYYFASSKAGKLTLEQSQKIWQNLANIMSDDELVNYFYDTYNEEV